MVESLLFIGAGAGAGQKRTGSATLFSRASFAELPEDLVSADQYD